MKRILVLFTLVLLLSSCGLSNKPAYTLEADVFGQEFIEDLEAANLKYTGEEVEITGILSGFSSDDDASISLITGLVCSFNGDAPDIGDVYRYQRVTIRGTVTEKIGLNDIELENCEFIGAVEEPELFTTGEEIDFEDLSSYLYQVIEVSATVKSVDLFNTKFYFFNSNYEITGLPGYVVDPNILFDQDTENELQRDDIVVFRAVVMSSSTTFGYHLNVFDIEIIENTKD